MFDFKKLISLQYLFEIDRVILTRSDKLFLVIGLACILLSVLFKIAARIAPSPVDRGYREKAYTLLLTVGSLEVVWFGARYQAIRFFGSHFFALVICLIGLVWLAFLLKDMARHYRSAKQHWEKEQIKLKYLPRQ